MTGRFRDLAERRVPQYLAIYVGVGWGLVQFISFLEDRYVLNPVWTDMTLLVVALLIPSVVLFTYNHGRPGRDAWTRSEKIGIPFNIFAVVAILFLTFGGRDLGAITDRKSVLDENGKSIERRVPRSEFRKRLAIFNFDANAADTTVAWLREGASSALALDLSQDIFLDIRVPALFREQLRDAGFPDGNNVPLTLKQKLASDMHLPYFITGTVTNGSEGYTVRVAVYETKTLKRLGERVSTNGDVLAVIDDLSQQVRGDLGLPDTPPEGVNDLPVANLLSDKPQALRAFIEGQNAAYHDDWKTAESKLVKATEIDPTFALAYYSIYLARVYLGNAQGALPALDLAMQNQYRLPERTQFSVKTEHYFMRQEMDNASRVIEMMVELYPDDLQGHAARAQMQEMRGDKAAAVESMQRIIELDPQQQDVLLKIGALQLELGDARAAEKTYGKYVAVYPNEVKGYLPLSRVQAQLGNHDAARESVRRALLIDPTHIDAQVSLALVDLETGEFDASWKRLQEALTAARTAEDRARALAGIQAYHAARGQYALAIAASLKRVDAVAGYAPPILALSEQMGAIGLYASSGRVAEANRVLERVRSGMTPPLDKFWHIGQLELAMQTRDTVQIRAAMVAVDSIIQAFNFGMLRQKTTRGDAVLHEVRGDWSGALQRYQQQQKVKAADISIQRDLSRMYRQLGRPADARRAIDQHLRVAPSSAESNLEAARVLIAAGDTAGAAAFVQRAQRTLAPADPGSAVVRELKELVAIIGTKGGQRQ